MRTVRNLAVVMLTTVSGSLAAQQPPAQQAANANNRWAEPKCDVKPNNVQVNQGMMSLKSSTTSKDPDQKKKDLDDAGRYLNQALTQGGQDKNPAAWYYLGRYYIMTNNAEGTDSAFTKAQALKPECKDDIGIWRRYVWVPTFNAGIAAWQANNIDSAIASFRRANFLLPSEPTGFKYVATLFYNTNHADSAVVYFRKAADVAGTDPKFAQDRRDALYNLGRIQQSMGKVPEALATYKEYVALYPNDAEIVAAMGGAYMQMGQKDSAFAVYRQIIARVIPSVISSSTASAPRFRGACRRIPTPRRPGAIAARPRTASSPPSRRRGFGSGVTRCRSRSPTTFSGAPPKRFRSPRKRSTRASRSTPTAARP